ncbi:DUF3990 domain-containing protein [Clostridium tagluense]|uniref:DUF3990 domain-containing protein n=1 Tax=Clostridium tagluense TaxID=360422 RepID=UPI001CF53DB3|nr:DUF3990 domain-containing protein [Clostridium tagluense]MCB2312908.1 DUF3990 domain-containing protein [Clostridium tagluense]MCB2317674.1 DUF3990 domain-containing protein [Clostridium tagluense]MCB2322492.1 DUF3990 domain-containing protein [Clostridium tagluense]MCB2327494.1 DUF3990 domain-containing protein [Clostridium tagluense]MCB2332213.1 DUF3990 domain-containing protein [Clostridium tagluense]
MRNEMELFHGSGVIVKRPDVLISGFYKDFGYGFYCTNIEKQAKRWALTKKPKHVINKYIYNENKELKILKFDNMTDEWLDFVVSCRRGISYTYDIVEGPMADDTIWDYIEDYIDGIITREAFWVLVKFKYPTHQIVFCNDKSLENLRYEGAYSL